jgi:cold shock CspA family protein
VVQLAQGLRLHPAADGGKDVFLHITVVRNAGRCSRSTRASSVRMKVLTAEEGPEAVQVELIA